LDALTSGDTTTAIESFNEIVAFLENVSDSSTLQGIIAGLNTSIAAKYTKPETGIPATDLAQAVQTILNSVANKANSADVYTKSQTYDKDAVDAKVADAGKVKSVTINGTKKTPNETTGDVDLGTIVGEQGPKGDKGDTLLVDGEFNPVTDIVNDMTTGGSDKVWSAGMGKKVAGREATDRQRIDAIVAILKKSVFTDDQTAAFAALDALANGIDSISFNVSSHKFTNIGDTFSLSVVTDPAGKTAQVTWASSNASVATVNGGVVTAVADGNTVITATTTDGKVAVCSIIVETIVITGISLNKSTLTLNGNNANETLVATTVPAGYESGVQWTSSDPTKATVDNNGKVTAVANGSTVITASIGGQTATCQVTVTGVMQTFHISVGTLSNVTIEDGQGNAITNGQAIMEGSSLAITFEPAASHVVDALSVVMGSTTLSLADATDGTDGAKVITIASVSGDIAISASASYQAKEYMVGAKDVEAHGMFDGYAQNNALNCKVVQLDFGKFYKLSGYNWYEQNGSSAYYIGLVKSDGNGGYTNIVPGTDVTKPANLTAENLTWGNVCIQHAGRVNNVYAQVDTLYFSVLPQSAYNNIDKVYLVINTFFSSDASKNITFPNLSVKEFRPITETMLWYAHTNNSFKYATYPNSPTGFVAKLFELDFSNDGKSYSYNGYTWQAQEGVENGYGMALVAVVDGIMRIIQKNEVQGVDSFFSDSTQCLKLNPSASGSFTIPSASSFASGIERVYLAINLQYGGDKAMDFSDFTLTENS